MSAAKAIIAGVEAVTKEWARQRKAEESNRRAEIAREDRLASRFRPVTIKKAAYYFLPEAYVKASGDGKLPVKARQLMYAARPKILDVTGRDTLNDEYFTQTLLPNFIGEHQRICATWDILWDARGHLVEPHTGLVVPVGTIEVRRYLAQCNAEPVSPASLALGINRHFATTGPCNRYRNILFIEKEGFDQILARAQVQERFDISVMSTKGMSVTAARMLIDQLADAVENVFVLHDFDISGFSIFGTLGSDSRRYRFANRVKLVDLGLRLADVERMSLESEPVPFVEPKEWVKRRRTLERHGATSDEIQFLRTRRVELNAMTSPLLIAFLEQAFQQHGVEELIPEPVVIEQHARYLLAQRDLAVLVKQQSEEIASRIAGARLPDDLGNRVRELLRSRPELPWDEVVGMIMVDGGGVP
jgi:hypothetical protein